MKTVGLARALCVLGTVLFGASWVTAQDVCIECHSKENLVREDGTSVHTSPEVFAASIHGEEDVYCTDCHADVDEEEFPHLTELEPVDCSDCHSKDAKKYAQGIHAQGREDGVAVAATCSDCHGSHDILAADDWDSKVNHFNVAATCSRCHASEEVALQGGFTNVTAVRSFQDSVHGRGVSHAGLTSAPSCSNCHGAHDIRRSSDPESTVSRGNIKGMCGGCHVGVLRTYDDAVHAAAITEGKQGPTCYDCHTSHSIKRGDLESWQLEVIKECGTCHHEQVESYRHTFHGQVTDLGFARVASCADCHGAHSIHSKEEPRSMVSAERRLETCQQCHPSANAAFAAYDPHPEPGNRERSAIVFYTAAFMKWLLIGVFTFFWIHTGLWLFRTLAERRRQTASAGPDA